MSLFTNFNNNSSNLTSFQNAETDKAKNLDNNLFSSSNNNSNIGLFSNNNNKVSGGLFENLNKTSENNKNQTISLFGKNTNETENKQFSGIFSNNIFNKNPDSKELNTSNNLFNANIMNSKDNKSNIFSQKLDDKEFANKTSLFGNINASGSSIINNSKDTNFQNISTNNNLLDFSNNANSKDNDYSDKNSNVLGGLFESKSHNSNNSSIFGANNKNTKANNSNLLKGIYSDNNNNNNQESSKLDTLNNNNQNLLNKSQNSLFTFNKENNSNISEKNLSLDKKNHIDKAPDLNSPKNNNINTENKYSTNVKPLSDKNKLIDDDNKKEIIEPKLTELKTKKLEESEKELLLRKSTEEIINRWKNELDKQIEKFNILCGRLKIFEEYFQKNFDNLIEINDILQSFDYNSNRTLTQLKNISEEEDFLINQLDVLDSILEGYLNFSDSLDLKNDKLNSTNNINIYDIQKDISKYVLSITNELNNLETKLYCAATNEQEIKNKISNLSTCDNQSAVLTSIINNFYSSLQGLKYMQKKIQFDITEACKKLNIVN